jgi:hypothetical protein
MALSSAVSAVGWLPAGGTGSLTTVAAVGSFSVTINRTPFEVSEIGDDNAAFIEGYQNVTATLDMFYSATDSARFETNITSAQGYGTLELVMTTGDTITGSAYVTSYSVTAAANDVVRASVGFQFTGGLTLA